MRHNKKFNHLGRTHSHRAAMLANMAVSLIVHKRITTTLPKAKALRVYVEPLITKAKEDTTHSRRIVFSYLQGGASSISRHFKNEVKETGFTTVQKHAIDLLFGEIAPKVGERPGGYTRFIKLGKRANDDADMAFIELVDFDENMAKTEAKKTRTRRSRKSAPKAEAPAAEAPVAEEAPAAAPAEAPAETPAETPAE